MKKSWPALLVLIAGCKMSDSAVKLPTGTIQIHPPILIQPSSGFLTAMSSDGKSYAFARFTKDKKGYAEVREWGSDRVLWQSKDEAYPTIFTSNGKGVFVEMNRTVKLIDIESGIARPSSATPLSLFSKSNAKHTILAVDPTKEVSNGQTTTHPGVIMLCTGRVVSVAGGTVQFDSTGRAWRKEKGRWKCVDELGNVSDAPKPSGGLVPNQAVVRGSMSLVVRQREERFRKAKAYLATIWITDLQAMPVEPGDDLAGQSKDLAGGIASTGSQAALVLSCGDFLSCGFVPGRNEIYVVTGRGTYIVPYTRPMTPAAKRSQ